MSEATTLKLPEKLKRCIGTPVVANNCEFHNPLKLGERPVLDLAVRKLGRSSIEFEINGRVSGEARFTARHKIAMMSLDTYRSIEIPAGIRGRAAEYLVLRSGITAAAVLP